MLKWINEIILILYVYYYNMLHQIWRQALYNGTGQGGIKYGRSEEGQDDTFNNKLL